MQNRLPAELPVSGTRYDLTLTQAGVDKRLREIVHFTIDSGEKRGVRVSSVLHGELKHALNRLCDIPIEETAAITLDTKHKTKVRISAVVTVSRYAKDAHGHFSPVSDTYTGSNVYVQYALSDFSPVEGETQLETAFKRKEKKFVRKPTGE